MQDVIRSFNKSLVDMWHALVERLPYVVLAVVTLVLFVFLGRLAALAFEKVGSRARLHFNLRQLFERLLIFAFVIIGSLVAATIVLPGFRPADLIAGLGITTVAIGFAFKDILQNFFAGILILWRRPFEVGDEICSGKYEGTVDAINSRSTRIRTYDGERAIIPNGEVYANPIVVYTAHPSRRLQLKVGIGYEESVDEARAVILDAIAGCDSILKDPAPAVYLAELEQTSVKLSIYFWISARENSLKAKSEVGEAVKRALSKAEIEVPLPQIAIAKNDMPAPETS